MTDLEPTPVLPTKPKPALSRKPPLKAGMHLLRRGHLYFGLLLFPWAILYGVTAFLFNHPSAFSDSGATTFGPDVLTGTPMETPGSAADEATRVVAVMNDRAKDGESYTLLTHLAPTYNRDHSFALVKTDDGQTINVGVNVTGQGGTVRGQPARPEAKPVVKAPFAMGSGGAGGSRGQRGEGGMTRPQRPSGDDGLKLADPLHERVKAAVPVVLERTGFPAGDVTVTSVPDLTFHVNDKDGQAWKVTSNTMTGTVTGSPADGPKEPTEISIRRFLLRLHTAHGYPSLGGVRWWWAVIVDAMAFVMVFWGLSGLLMWWQLKATRRLGIVLVVLSLFGAGYLAMGMHSAMTGG
jgi:hypothetical protein